MLKFILVAFLVIGFLVFSIPILIAEKNIGKTDPEKKGRQSHSPVYVPADLKGGGDTYHRKGHGEHPRGHPGAVCGQPQKLF